MLNIPRYTTLMDVKRNLKMELPLPSYAQEEGRGSLMEYNSTQQPPHKTKLTYEAMLKKLDDLYDQKEVLAKQLEELQYDIEFLENMIMYRYNKEDIKKKE